MFYVICGTYVVLCCLVEFVYYKLQKTLNEMHNEWEQKLNARYDAEEAAEEARQAYRSDLDFDFHVTVDKVRFGDET